MYRKSAPNLFEGLLKDQEWAYKYLHSTLFSSHRKTCRDFGFLEEVAQDLYNEALVYLINRGLKEGRIVPPENDDEATAVIISRMQQALLWKRQDHQKKSSTRNERDSLEGSEALGEDFSAEDMRRRTEQREIIAMVYARLGFDCRESIRLKEEEGYSWKEIARLLNRIEGTLKNEYNPCKMKFREEYLRLTDGELDF